VQNSELKVRTNLLKGSELSLLPGGEVSVLLSSDKN
jgi:hypothetical protein